MHQYKTLKRETRRGFMRRMGVLGGSLLGGMGAWIPMGCRPPMPDPAEDGVFRVLTTVLPLYSLASTIGGEETEVQNFLPPGVGPHEYSFTVDDVRKVAGSDVILQVGLGLDEWLDKLVRQTSRNAGDRVHRMGPMLPSDRLRVLESEDHGHDHDHGHHHHGHWDPHVWQDPSLMAEWALQIGGILGRSDASHESLYRERSRQLADDLLSLDEEYRSVLEAYRGVGFVTFHDAFGYLVSRYGLRLTGVVEVKPDVPPSPSELTKLVQNIRKEEAKVLFTEPQFAPRLAEQLAKDTGIRIAELDPLETGDLTPDAYLKGMRRNLEVLKECLAP